MPRVLLTQKIASPPAPPDSAVRGPDSSVRGPDSFRPAGQLPKTSKNGCNGPDSMAESTRTAMAAAALLVAASAGFLHLADHGTALTAGPLSSMVAVCEVKKSGKRRHGHRPDEQRLGPDENRTAAARSRGGGQRCPGGGRN